MRDASITNRTTARRKPGVLTLTPESRSGFLGLGGVDSLEDNAIKEVKAWKPKQTSGPTPHSMPGGHENGTEKNKPQPGKGKSAVRGTLRGGMEMPDVEGGAESRVRRDEDRRAVWVNMQPKYVHLRSLGSQNGNAFHRPTILCRK